MILKGSQRGGAGQLAAHLLNDHENDHVTVVELKGFVSDDLTGALQEAHAIANATQCQQFLFSLSLNPPKGETCSIDDLIQAADRAEETLGLTGQPRAVIVHEKNGRRHAHVVWSRIDSDELKAVPMAFYKNRLAALSKELYLEHGWELPDGHKQNGWKNPLNFTLDEWQQAKRLGLDPRELKQLVRETWGRSDSARAFKSGLEDHGFTLAKGDRRGFVLVDIQGEVFSLSRVVGLKTKELTARLGSPDNLPTVGFVTEQNTRLLTDRTRELLAEARAQEAKELQELEQKRRAVIEAQRAERSKLQAAQDQRRILETRERQDRFRKGVLGFWDRMTGKAAEIKRENEAQAFASYKRDAEQRERLFEAQAQERQEIVDQIDECRKAQRANRIQIAGQMAFLMGLERMEKAPVSNSHLNRSLSIERDFM
jgi:hypothetical protein